jgi:GNAT superfamily N-acetyltransferase
MKLARRRYRDEQDDWRIRAFLREVFLLNDRRAVCWPVYRWDYWRWHAGEQVYPFSPEAGVFLWETGDGQLAAVLHPHGPGEALMQVHPAFRSPELEVEMMMTAETQYALCQSSGQCLALWAHDGDALRQDLLARRGYRCAQPADIQYRRALDQPLPRVLPPTGYTLRPLAGEGDLPARSWLAWKAFHAGEPDERYPGWAWYRTLQRAPLYRRDLDLVAVAPDGELAACCTIWLDEATCTAGAEPVGTHPAHRRKGLAWAILAEGLRRAHHLGATLGTVSSTAEAAGGLCAALGLTDCGRSEPWAKTW